MSQFLKRLACKIPGIGRVYERAQDLEMQCGDMQKRISQLEESLSRSKVSHNTGPVISNEWVLIDREHNCVYTHAKEITNKHPISELAAFYAVAKEYLGIGWVNQYHGTFTWLGEPFFQIPDDLMRLQELVWRVKPDVIIETGIWKGASLLFFSSMCRLVGKGRVIGIDVIIEEDTYERIRTHPLGDVVTMYKGSSTDAAILEQIKKSINPGEKVLIILDSDHSKAHVAAELEAYSEMVTKDSFIVVCDGIMRDLAGRHESAPASWKLDNPFEAAKEFAHRRSDFVWEEPRWIGSKTALVGFVNRYFSTANMNPADGEYATRSVTYSPGAYLRKR